jgi:hypothetical protein
MNEKWFFSYVFFQSGSPEPGPYFGHYVYSNGTHPVEIVRGWNSRLTDRRTVLLSFGLVPWDVPDTDTETGGG